MIRVIPRLSRPDVIALVVAAAFFMEGLDASIIAPAIPQIAQDFQVSPATLSSGISAYLISVAVFIPASGWAADRFGVRAVFCTAIAVFTLASIWCAQAGGLTEFIVARVLQGAGGAMMSPVGRVEVLRKTPRDQFIRALALVSWPGLTAFVIGPALGGFLTTYASWRWIFYINLPLGVVAFALVWKLMGSERPHPRPFDWAGFLLNGGALGAFMYGLETLGHDGRRDIGIAALAAGIVLGLLALRHMRRAAHPLISIEPLRHQTFSVGVLTGGLPFRLVIGAGSFLYPVMFQLGLGFDAFDAGLLMLAHAVGDLAMKLRATYFVRRFGFRNVLLVNGALLTLSILVTAAFAPGWPFWLLALVMLVNGAFRSQQFTALTAITFSDVPHEGIANATAVSNILQQVSIGLGVAAAALLLVGVHGDRATVFTLGEFHVVLLILAGVAFATLAVYARLSAQAGEDVSGRRNRSAGRGNDPA